MMQPEPVVSSSPNSLHGREDSGNIAVAAAVAAAVEDSQQLVLGCGGGGGNGSGSGNFISNHPPQQQHAAAQYKGDEIAERCRMQSLLQRQLCRRGQVYRHGPAFLQKPHFSLLF